MNPNHLEQLGRGLYYAPIPALTIDAGFDLSLFHTHLRDRLPSYARPLFLRIRGALDVTETFKPKTHHLAREGFDPAAIADTKVAPPSVLLFGAEYTVRGPMLSRLPLLNTIDPGTAVRAGCSSVMPGNVSFEFTAAPRSTIPSAWSVAVQTSPVQVRGPVVTL